MAAARLEAFPDGVSSDKFKFNKKRVRTVAGNVGFLAREAKSVVYYMHRDQRVQDNWALIYAQSVANEHNLPLSVVTMVSVKHPQDTGTYTPGFIFVRTIFVQNGKCSPFSRAKPSCNQFWNFGVNL